MPEPQLVQVDWINLEGRLTAYFSGDENLTRMLEDELRGGHKVHAITAGLLYDIDPADAKTHLVNLQGHMVPAYDGGKRFRHMFHYGGRAKKMSQTFWIALKEAEEKYEIIADMHPGVVAWWKDIGDDIFGIHIYECPRCQRCGDLGGDCPACRLEGLVMPMRWAGWAQEPERVAYTPFGRRRIYQGRRSQSMNPAIAQKPQSSGASMWYRVLGHLRNWSGTYGDLLKERSLILTGTYDSFLSQTGQGKTVEDVVEWIARPMEQPWTDLGGLRFPVDVMVGSNWRKYDAKRNPRGLRDFSYRPFSA